MFPTAQVGENILQVGELHTLREVWHGKVGLNSRRELDWNTCLAPVGRGQVRKEIDHFESKSDRIFPQMARNYVGTRWQGMDGM